MKLQEELGRNKYPYYRTINASVCASFLPNYEGVSTQDSTVENNAVASSRTSPNNGSAYLIPALPICNSNVFNYSHHIYRSRYYTEDEDIFLILMLYHHGYGNWDRIRREIQYNQQFKYDILENNANNTPPQSSLPNYSQAFQFDWFLKTRNNIDLQKRSDVLLHMLEREYEKYLKMEQEKKDEEACEKAENITEVKDEDSSFVSNEVTSNIGEKSEKGLVLSIKCDTKLIKGKRNGKGDVGGVVSTDSNHTESLSPGNVANSIAVEGTVKTPTVSDIETPNNSTKKRKWKK